MPARLDPVHNGPRWRLTWSTAGHPPPLLRTPDAHVALLTEHDILLHQDFGPSHRIEHQRTLPPGSTLLLHTDGLIERPSHDIDTAIAELVALLARHGDGSLPHLVRRISKRLADPHPGDDVVVLAVRVT
ncbi:PP2C family protein-serine/threonine phosphatase [Streptomyces olivochromogenes]|uniref:PP2C family protein-serine/threonine phosphatase n=1 Tax=Streptomyces olivochromogenes TaxID=1963 RepID=UPI0036DC9E8C